MALAEHRIETGDGKIRAVSRGEGPVVLMVHGNPGVAFSWRHQMQPVADAGYKAVAIDLMGYGLSDRPEGLENYDAAAMERHLIAVLDYFKAEQAIMVGQDFGAQFSWNLAVRRPERVSAIAATVPYDFDLAGRGLQGLTPDPSLDHELAMSSPASPPSVRFANMAKQHFIHFHYFQEIGPAEAELTPQLREYTKRLMHALSADGKLLEWDRHASDGAGYMDVLAEAPPLPWPWLSEAEFDHIVELYNNEGPELSLVGPLAHYRVADRNWEQGKPYAEANVMQPTLFICGAADPVLQMVGADWEERLRARIPNMRAPVLIEGAGHMVQQEKPEEFTKALLEFINSLPASARGAA